MRRSSRAAALLALVGLAAVGCQTYYEKIYTFNSKFEQGDFGGARSYLAGQKKLSEGGARVLYHLNYGTASFMLDDSQESIRHFAEADRYVSDFSKNYAYEALALISNPTVRPYETEYFENVMLHFYQALNYVKLNDFEEALVECRRMNLELDKLSDAFRKHDGKRYSRDAFGHLLQGLLYETRGDQNNAFVAYRNAAEIYEADYAGMYGVATPELLKAAVIRTAYRTGLAAEGRKFEKQYGRKYAGAADKGKGRAVVFVLDGLGPVKNEVAINFTKVDGVGCATFTSGQYGLSVPVYYGDCTREQQQDLRGLANIRLTLPQYVDRRGCSPAPLVSVDGSAVAAEVCEDIARVAHQSLRDRMWREVGLAVLRTAAKEALRRVAAEKNEYVGLLVNLAGMVTEKADTRSWSSLPARVRVVEAELSAGHHELRLQACGRDVTLDLDVRAGQTAFACLRAF